MGSDLHWMHESIVQQSHPQLVATLRMVRERLMRSRPDWPDFHDVIAEIDRALNNASIR